MKKNVNNKIDKWYKLNEEFDTALDSMTTNDWNKYNVKKKDKKYLIILFIVYIILFFLFLYKTIKIEKDIYNRNYIENTEKISKPKDLYYDTTISDGKRKYLETIYKK